MADVDSNAPFENRLTSPSFQGLLWTNWLTVINDNAFRWLVIGIGKDYVAPENRGLVLMAGTVCFVLPYLIFAAPAGFLADRFGKRDVIVTCKFAEIVIMAIGIVFIVNGQFYWLLFVLFLMGAQSALFAPAKVGTIPELLDEHKISAANGVFNLSTLTATIIGMAIGGWLSDQTGAFGQSNTWLSALVLVGTAVAGTLISFAIRRLPAANPQAHVPVTIVRETMRDLKALASNGPLFRVALGIVFFWSIGALGQLNIDQFAQESGALYESDRTPLLISLILGVGLGSVLAGWFSAGRIELGLVPWGAMGIVLFCAMLVFSPTELINNGSPWSAKFVIACGLLLLLGVSAGIYDVPLASYLQHRSPIENRGRILAANNLMIFTGILVSAFLFGGLRAGTYPGKWANMPPALRGTDLSAQQQADSQLAALEYQSALARLSPEQRHDWVAKRLPAESDPTYPHSLARLIWEEMTFRRKQQEVFVKEDYYQRYPHQLSAVKHAFEQSSKQPLLTSRQIFGVMALLAMPVWLYCVWRLPQAMVRILMLWITRVIYRVRIRGMDNIPENGGAVLVGNHISWVDGALYLILIPRRLRMIAWAGNFKSLYMRMVAKFCRIILISGGPKSIQRGLAEARKALARGEVVGLFPEGGITRTGQVQSFRPGLMRILDQMPVPIVPVYLDEFWGSIFTYSGGKSLTKFPSSFRHPLELHIGEPLWRPQSIHEIRQAVVELGADAALHRQTRFRAPIQHFIGSSKKRRFRMKIADSSGARCSGSMLLARTMMLRRLLRRHLLQHDEDCVGVLLPPSLGGSVVNLALAMDRRTVVNLNYTIANDLVNQCVSQAGIRHVLSTQKVMDKLGFQLDVEVCYIEQLRDKVTLADKLTCITAAYLVPAPLLERLLGVHRIDPDDVITIIFTSGSTGTPKGVMLTQHNIATNVQAIAQMVNLSSKDTLVGLLPFFHSFGYTITMWAAMELNVSVVYHFNPLDARQVGQLCQSYRATCLLTTPTFLRNYLRKCTTEQMQSLDVVVAGAERLPEELCDAFENKFGVRPVEGYGATELSPLVTVNVPPSRSTDNFQIDCKEGTVGRPVPNVAARITDHDSGETLGVNQPGVLWIKGPNVMKGYLNRPDLTADVIHDGWYNTGDMALIDEDGFVRITGRISRFSKIGGEMVPHIKIEETLSRLVGKHSDDQAAIAVTAVPDERKGERLIVLHTKIDQNPQELCNALAQDGLPNIFIPSANSFFQVDDLPLLGSGKLDLRAIKQLAEKLVQRQREKE